MIQHLKARHALTVALLAIAVGACGSGGAKSTPSTMAPLEAAAPEGGIPGKVLDSKKVDAGGQSVLRYTVRLDDGRDVTVDEPASRYLGNGDLVYVVDKGGKPYLVKR